MKSLGEQGRYFIAELVRRIGFYILANESNLIQPF